MASMRAFTRRVSSLLLKRQTTDNVPAISSSAVHTFNSRTSSKLQTVLSNLAPNLLSRERARLEQCRYCRRQHWNGVAANSIPQLDLEHEGDEGKTSPAKPVNPTEVLSNLNAEEARRLKIIKLEFDVIEQMSGLVPETMTDEFWLHAFELESKAARMRYYRFLRKIEMKDKSKKKKQQLKQQQREETAAATEAETEETEKTPKNTIFLMVYDTTMKKYGDYRLAQAMQFGPPLVFDMDYEQYMRHQDTQNLVSQLLMTYSKNRDAKDPFHIMFTSLDPNGKMFSMLNKAKMTGQNFMGTMTDRSYLDLFPKQRLVYLSPHASETLDEISEDDVYIVGAFNDKSWPKPVSLARAKEQGLRTAKFPLDKYLLWGCGSKCLTIDQVMLIMLEQRRTKDWQEAFRAIPQRKLHRDN